MYEIDKPCLERLIKETKYADVNAKGDIDYTILIKDLEAHGQSSTVLLQVLSHRSIVYL